jgi:hypothetical protein
MQPRWPTAACDWSHFHLLIVCNERSATQTPQAHGPRCSRHERPQPPPKPLLTASSSARSRPDRVTAASACRSASVYSRTAAVADTTSYLRHASRADNKGG